MDCKETCTQLWDYLDGKLDNLTHKEMEVHLRTCAECKKALEQVVMANALIAEERIKTPDPFFVQKVMDGLNRDEKTASFESAFYRYARSAAAAVLILLAAATGIFLGLPASQTTEYDTPTDAFAKAYGLEIEYDNIFEDLTRE